MFPFKETKPANPMLHFFLYFQWTPQSVFVFGLLSLSLSSASVSVCVFCLRVCQLAHAEADTETTFVRRSSGLIDKGASRAFGTPAGPITIL